MRPPRLLIGFTILLFAALGAGTSFAQPESRGKSKGPGVIDGDAFSIANVPTELSTGLPNKSELNLLVTKISDSVGGQKIGRRMARALERFANGTYHVYRMEGTHTSYATFRHYPTRRERLPENATVVLWPEFDELPVDTTEGLSQVKVLAAVLLRLAATSELEFATEDFLDLLMRRSAGERLSDEDGAVILAFSESLLSTSVTPTDDAKNSDVAERSEGQFVDWADDAIQGNVYDLIQRPVTLVRDVPNADILVEKVLRAARVFPGPATVILEALERFKRGQTHRMYNLHAGGDDHFLRFHVGADHPYRQYGLAEIQIAPEFFSLPVDIEDSDGRTQVGALLHDLVHVTLTGRDEGATKLITRALLKVAAGSAINRHDTVFMKRILSNPGLRIDFRAIARTYALANGARSACEIFPLGDPVAIGGREFSFPTFPEGFTDLLAGDPFFAAFRDSCWLKHPTGVALVIPDGKGYGYVSRTRWISSEYRGHPLFRHPHFMGLVLDHIRGKPLRTRVSGNSFYGFPVHDAAYSTGWDKLVEKYVPKEWMRSNFGPVEPSKNPMPAEEFERVVPGYRRWVELLRVANPDRPIPRSFRLDAGWLVQFPFRWLAHLAKAYPEGFTLGGAKSEGDTRISVPSGWAVRCRADLTDHASRNRYVDRYDFNGDIRCQSVTPTGAVFTGARLTYLNDPTSDVNFWGSSLDIAVGDGHGR